MREGSADGIFADALLQVVAPGKRRLLGEEKFKALNFCYTWGYREGDGTFEWYPEFDKPLGPPQGEAKRAGWTFTRDFAHASVSVDLEAGTARIDWRPCGGQEGARSV